MCRIKDFFLGYLATACFFRMAIGLSDAFFYFALKIPRIGYFNFGFVLCGAIALAKFGTALTMGGFSKKVIKTAFLCFLLSIGLWALFIVGTQIIDAYADQGFYFDRGFEPTLTFLGLCSAALSDELILDRMLKGSRSDNAVLALYMNVAANGLLLFLFSTHFAWR